MAKIEFDKYYTPLDLAKYCIDKTFEVLGAENISHILEPSAGNGSFSKQIDGCIAMDIEPEDSGILRADFFEYNAAYIPQLLVIGNPPYGRCFNVGQKFYKKAVLLGDYVSFILPISQLNNTQSLYEFDLIHSEDLGKRIYTDRNLHCCLNIYKRPSSGELNPKVVKRLKDVTIYRQDCRDYAAKEFDIRLCYWGDGTAGKVLKNGEQYSGEYKIKINNARLKPDIIRLLNDFNWSEYLNCIAMRKIQQFHIVKVLLRQFPELT